MAGLEQTPWSPTPAPPFARPVSQPLRDRAADLSPDPSLVPAVMVGLFVLARGRGLRLDDQEISRLAGDVSRNGLPACPPLAPMIDAMLANVEPTDGSDTVALARQLVAADVRDGILLTADTGARTTGPGSRGTRLYLQIVAAWIALAGLIGVEVMVPRTAAGLIAAVLLWRAARTTSPVVLSYGKLAGIAIGVLGLALIVLFSWQEGYWISWRMFLVVTLPPELTGLILIGVSVSVVLACRRLRRSCAT